MTPPRQIQIPPVPFPLEEGEVIWWSGAPEPHVYAQRMVHHLIYGATWLILGSFWYYGSGGIGANSVFEGWWKLMPLGSAPFMITGAWLLWRPVEAARKARMTSYFVTNRRAIIFDQTAVAEQQMRSYRPAQLHKTEDRIRWDSAHDLILTKRFQDLPHLLPALDAAFLGLSKKNSQLALASLEKLMA